jgi:2-polyprenyl-6-methoxyphenol hydroxylase-like FAD-dependent oxidoreductase/predicted DsbA family dithiol-disulfide isomerase
MRVVIIGGGIAGMALAILLRKKGIDFSLNERDAHTPKFGHAFLIHPDAMQVLDIISEANPDFDLPGQIIDKIVLKRPDDSILQTSELDSWICIKRVSIIKYLSSILGEKQINFNRQFSHFIYEGDKAIAAEFTNGEIEYGDVFIGADGAHSLVRNSLFGEVEFSRVDVKEIVGVVENPDLILKFPNTFTKYMSDSIGLAVGLIPCSEEKMVWFMQYDIKLEKGNVRLPEELKEHCTRLLANFPAEVQEVLSSNDFSKNYIWRSTDFDLLPSFNKSNVVLIGDAAHVAMPFTSAGTTNALLDAYKIAEVLSSGETFADAFADYYQVRSAIVGKQIQLGREIKYNFLNQTYEEIKLPLIVNQKNKEEVEIKHNLEILYFTDPVCSTCWLVQPQLRKLALQYGDYFELKYYMGGLLPNWDNYSRRGIEKPSDAASYWQALSEEHQMPISSDVWLNSPLSSSFPPSIALKAAQMQNKIKAYHFHRRIKELLFVESKNITEISLLLSTAEEVGLDKEKLSEDIGKIAFVKFNEDLELASELNITVLPTFILTNELGEKVRIEGYQEFETMEEAILKLNTSAKKDSRKREPIELFRFFQSLTTHEFSYLMEITPLQTELVLKNLYQIGLIYKKTSKAGTIWILNQGVL